MRLHSNSAKTRTGSSAWRWHENESTEIYTGSSLHTALQLGQYIPLYVYPVLFQRNSKERKYTIGWVDILVSFTQCNTKLVWETNKRYKGWCLIQFSLTTPTQILLWLISAEVDTTHHESQACCGEQLTVNTNNIYISKTRLPIYIFCCDFWQSAKKANQLSTQFIFFKVSLQQLKESFSCTLRKKKK